MDRRDDHALIRRCGAPSPPPPVSPNDDRASARHAYAWPADRGTRRYAAERGSAIPTPPTTLHTRTAYTPNRRHDSASSATYPPTRPRLSRLMLSAISPAPRRQSGSAHRAAPGRYAYLRSLSRPLPLRPVPPATAPARPPVQVAHPLPPALHERKGNHAHNGQEKRNGKQHQRQARRGDPSRQDHRHHLAEHPHGTKACSTASTSPAYSAAAPPGIALPHSAAMTF